MVRLHRMRLSVEDSSLVPVLDSIRAELELPPVFPDEVEAQARLACDEWERFTATVRPESRVGSGDAAPDDLLDFPPLTGADEAAAQSWNALVAGCLPTLDATRIPLVTIDPPESRDLDQAVHLARLSPGREDGAAYLVTYAIASPATFISAGSPLDEEVRRRGLTVYLPDHSTPLHPLSLSEGAASLLPDRLAPACVWQILLDSASERVSATVRRALVRSRAKLSHGQVDAARETGSRIEGAPADLVELLGEIGEARRRLETARGGVSAPTPEQEITRVAAEDGSTHYELAYRETLAVEEWNAQISLLTGISAAAKMREAGLGILRTVPPAPDSAFDRLRAVARLLGVAWDPGTSYADLVPTLNPADPAHAAFLAQAMSLYRGAAYSVFADSRADAAVVLEVADEGAPGAHRGAADSDEAAESTAGRAAHCAPFPPVGAPSAVHAAIAAEYAHTTAPLRRLVDRWSSEICLAHDARRPMPRWLLESLASMPGIMGEAAHRASQAERSAVGVVSAKILLGHEGETFRGVIVERRANGDGNGIGNGARNGGARPRNASDAQRGPSVERGRVMVAEPAVMATVTSTLPAVPLPLGEETDVTLALADVEAREVEFTWSPVGE